MQRCTYRALEFTKSDLEPNGLTFVVLLRFNDLPDKFFKSFYLDGWREVIGTGFEAEISYVEDVLYDFRQFARKSFAESDEVMEVAANLSTGPVRTVLVGTGGLPPLAEIHPELRDDLDTYTCSEISFAALLQSIVENSDSA